MQIQGECAEFATKQRHLAYAHLESLQPRTLNAFFDPVLMPPFKVKQIFTVTSESLKPACRMVLTPLA